MSGTLNFTETQRILDSVFDFFHFQCDLDIVTFLTVGVIDVEFL